MDEEQKFSSFCLKERNRIKNLGRLGSSSSRKIFPNQSLSLLEKTILFESALNDFRKNLSKNEKSWRKKKFLSKTFHKKI